MLERKCVKSYRLLQHGNGVTRFKHIENQSRNHALRKGTPCQCMRGNGNSLALYIQTKASHYFIYRLMRPIFVNATKTKRCNI